MKSTHGLGDLTEFIPIYEHLLADNLSLLLDRHDRRPDYPFIDTKLSLISGKDFEERTQGYDITGRDVIYSWIQARGLEALAGHLAWIPTARTLGSAHKNALASRSRHLLVTVLDTMESLRQVNTGRLSFMLSTSGVPLQVEDDGRVTAFDRIAGDANFSDLFYAKGLYAAGHALHRPGICANAEVNLRQIINAIFTRSFASDQQPMDPRNRIGEVPGRFSHGPYMIALGGVATLLESTAHQEWAHIGATLIQHILDHHVNHGQFAHLPAWDFVEFIDSNGDPWRTGGIILCDPGHSIEFVGLACNVLLAARATGTLSGDLADTEQRCREALPALFKHVFELGFSAREIGIYKAIDLITRQPCNTTIPWWSLPETLRAGALLMTLWPDRELQDTLKIFRKSHSAFFGHFVNPAVYSMAFQTLDVAGNPADVIPAVPDADPCYHTGLSLLDVLSVLYREALENFPHPEQNLSPG